MWKATTPRPSHAAAGGRSSDAGGGTGVGAAGANGAEGGLTADGVAPLGISDGGAAVSLGRIPLLTVGLESGMETDYGLLRARENKECGSEWSNGGGD